MKKRIVLFPPQEIDKMDASYGMEKIKNYACKDSKICEHFNIEIVPLNSMIDFEQKFHQLLETGAIDLVGFSTFLWNVHHNIRDAEGIKIISPSTKVIFGGPQVSDVNSWNAMEYSNAIDFVAAGEGERTFYNFLKFWQDTGTLEDITVKGISYRNPNNTIVNNLPTPPIGELDTIPFSYMDKALDRNKFYGLETNRGCYHNCAYCGTGSQKFREHSLEYVLREIENMADSGAEKIILLDSSFTYNKKRAKKIAAMFKKYRLRYVCCAKAEELNDELIDIIIDSGVLKIEFGLQSTNPEALKAMRRPWNPDRFSKNLTLFMERSKNTDIEVNVDLICGLPGDNLVSFKESLNYSYSFFPKKIAAFPLQLLPGTEFFKNRDLYKIKTAQSHSSDIKNLRSLHRYLYHKFNLVEENFSFTRNEIDEGIKICKLNGLFFQSNLIDLVYLILKNENINFSDFYNAFSLGVSDELFSSLDSPSLDIDVRRKIWDILAAGFSNFANHHCRNRLFKSELDIILRKRFRAVTVNTGDKNQTGQLLK